MLPLVAILLFALFGFGAVAVDLGVASLASVRLQTASDAVALACGGVAEGTECDEDAWGPVYDATLPAPTTWTPLGEPTRPPVVGEWSQPGDTAATWTVGQTIPLLFGQGSQLNFNPDDSTGMAEIQAARNDGSWFVDDPDGGYRESGFRLRARSRVRFDPVVRIGRQGEPGRAPFGLSATCAGRLAQRESLDLSIQTDIDGAVSGLVVGSGSTCPAFPLDLSGPDGFELGTLGTSVDAGRQAFEDALLPSALEQRTVYAPLAGPLADPADPADTACRAGEVCTVVGFVKLDVERDGDGDLVLELSDDRAAGNASALCRMLAGRTCADPDLQPVTNTRYTLRAPVLVADPGPPDDPGPTS